MGETILRHPLDGCDPIAAESVTLTPLPETAVAPAFAPAGEAAPVASRLGWPEAAGPLIDTDHGLVGSVAPGQWLVTAPEGRAGDLAKTLGAADPALRVSDQGAGRAAIAVAGDRLADLLALGCRVDLAGLPPGTIAQTAFGPIAIALLRPPGRPDRAILLATSGYARALWEALAEAAATL